jgi:hypothetical protein
VLLTEVLGEVRKVLPFPLLGFDTDNDSVFLNETVRDYCTAAGVEFTRCRPYRKNDQAFVEQKNGAVVRRAVGYRRLEGLEAAAALAELYRSLRLFVNVFQPSFKLAEKSRDGAVVRKRYHSPETPHRRLLADPRVTDEVRARVTAMAAGLDPVRLLAEIRSAQARLVEIADRHAGDGRGDVPGAPTLEEFLAGLRTAWREGEVRPTAKPKAAPVRWWRTRADPFAGAWPQLRAWFDAEPDRTARELLERLVAGQEDGPGEAQLRTLQRRLKIWRAEKARKLVFGTREGGGEATAVGR